MSSAPPQNTGMGKTKTTPEFIAEAVARYGDKYDYSTVVYKRSDIEVEIICPKHGPFLKKPAFFLRGHACQRCGYETSALKNTKPRKTKKKFVEQAREKHGDKYDYSAVIYVRSKDKVIIECPIHGAFLQSPEKHLSGRGCPDCANENRNRNRVTKAREDFSVKARQVHGDKYDYSQVVYRDRHHPVTIVCPMHGAFKQRPSSHLRGAGCDDCWQERRGDAHRKSMDGFLSELRKQFGSQYDYSDVQYLNCHTPVKLRCNKPGHGFFERRPVDLIKGMGCQKCGWQRSSEKQALTTDEFIEKARQIHGEKYDYSRVKYINQGTPIEILCPDHGAFSQLPGNHLQEKGCNKCGKEMMALLGKTVSEHRRLGLEINGRFYVINIFNEEENFFKVGITIKTVRQRWRSLPDYYDYELVADLPMNLIDAWMLEQDVLLALTEKQYFPKLYFGGITECLSINPVESHHELMVKSEEAKRRETL